MQEKKSKERLVVTPELAKAKRDSKFKKDPGNVIGIQERKLAEEIEKNPALEQFLIIDYKENGEIKSVKVNIPMVTNHLLEKYNFKTIYETKSEKIYVYLNGVYKNNGRKVIQTQIEKLLGSFSTNYCVKEIVEKIKRSTAIEPEDFNTLPEELICLENGILNLKNLEIEEYNSKYYFKRKINIIYDVKAKCPLVMGFFEECLYPEDLPVVQEWFGFCLYRNYFIKKAIILFGTTDTGKTVLVNLITKWVGEKNTSGLSLQRISSGDKFGLADLKDKMVNVFDDLTSEDMISGGFKIATGGGYITAEHKFGDPFQFQNFAKLTFAGNKIPSVKEIDSEDAAYYDRWIPLALDNQIEKDIQDRFLIKKLTTPRELSGLLNWALVGLKRLFDNGKFSFKKDWREVKGIMERYSGNPLVSFCQDVLIEEVGNKITKEEMYEIYSLYVKNKEFPRLSKEQIGRSLPKFCKYLIARGGKERIWLNVGINKNNYTYYTSFNILRDECIKESKINTNSLSLYKKSGEVSEVSVKYDSIDTISEKYPKEFKEIQELIKNNPGKIYVSTINNLFKDKFVLTEEQIEELIILGE